ncbi:LysR family transcriptional regulator, partial [Dokdonella sp.]|uniref:LysR family transcriptional regulator n=1 Tax=Dokdonella sp. TaxID=2291710 RepID=UPI002F4195AE
MKQGNGSSRDRTRSARKPERRSSARTGRGEGTAQPPRFYYKGSRIKQLRAFCMIVKLGTLSRAAEALFLSQPSVSLQLRALEQEFGATLIERRRRRVAPTREGQALYDLALPLVDGLDQLEHRFNALRSGLAGGELHIAAGTSTIQYLLPGFVAAFREQHPGVKLQLHNVTGKDGLALLRSDQVDFAVGSMLDVPNDLSYEPVHSYDPMLITPLDHPLAKLRDVRLEDLSPYGLILPPQRLTTYRLVDLIF